MNHHDLEDEDDDENEDEDDDEYPGKPRLFWVRHEHLKRLAHFRGLRRCGKNRASTVDDLAVMAEFVPGVKQTRRRVWLRCIADGCLVAVLLAF